MVSISSSSPLAGINVAILIKPGEIPAVLSAPKERSHTTEKTTSTAKANLTSSSASVRTASSLPAQHRHAMLRSPSSNQSVLAGIAPSTSSLSSSSSSLSLVVDPKEGKNEVIFPPASTNRVASPISNLQSAVKQSRRSLTINKQPSSSRSSASTVQSSSPPSLPKLSSSQSKGPTRENSLVNVRLKNIRLKKMLERQVHDFVDTGDLQSALECIKKIIKIAQTIEVSRVYMKSIQQLEKEIRIKQIETCIGQLGHNSNAILIPMLKDQILIFLNKYSIREHSEECEEFIIRILKIRIELNYNDYSRTHLQDDLLQFESDFDKLKKLCGSIAEESFIMKWQGILYHLQLKIEQALETLEKALALIPNDFLIITHMGLLYIKKAEEEIVTDDPLTEYQMVINKKAGYDKALKYFKKALEIKKNNPFALKWYAHVSFKLKVLVDTIPFMVL